MERNRETATIKARRGIASRRSIAPSGPLLTAGFSLAQALHLPLGETYTAYLHNDLAYWMLDAVRNCAERGGC